MVRSITLVALSVLCGIPTGYFYLSAFTRRMPLLRRLVFLIPTLTFMVLGIWLTGIAGWSRHFAPIPTLLGILLGACLSIYTNPANFVHGKSPLEEWKTKLLKRLKRR
jgi:hypothetical protein